MCMHVKPVMFIYIKYNCDKINIFVYSNESPDSGVADSQGKCMAHTKLSVIISFLLSFDHLFTG